MESHQKNGRAATARICRNHVPLLPLSVDFENFVYVSQVSKRWPIKTAVTAVARLKARHCMGTFGLAVNDNLASVVLGLSLTMAGAGRCCIILAQDFMRLWTVVVMLMADDLRCCAAVMTCATGLPASMPAYACAMTARPGVLGQASTIGDSALNCCASGWAIWAAQEMLVLGWTASDGSKGGDVFAPRSIKDLRSVAAQLTCQSRQKQARTCCRSPRKPWHSCHCRSICAGPVRPQRGSHLGRGIRRR